MVKNIITAMLLGFVVVAVVTVALRSRGTATTTDAQATTPATTTPSATVATSASVLPAVAIPRLVSFYFHGTKRCQSCKSIERLTREALQAAVDAGQVEIRSVNVDEAANAHYAEDFQLTMRTVVLAEETGGKANRWTRLDECWDRFGDPADFTAYVQRSLATFRDSAPAAP